MRITARKESWPIAGEFRIARGAKTQAEVVLVEVEQDGISGRGECVPYTRYGETVDGVIETLRQIARTHAVLDRTKLQKLLPPGAARNALDCALWHVEARRTKTPVWKAAGLPKPGPAMTSYTLSLQTPEQMAEAARLARHWPLLKIKLDGNRIQERLLAVCENAPTSKLIIDANESWSMQQLNSVLSSFTKNIALIEQPLPAGHDDDLYGLDAAIPLCADESVHDSSSLDKLAGKYQAINIKLDKTGGLTEAIRLAKRAKTLNLQIMVGCMVGTSLGMAPAMMLSELADYVDLDGPLLLARDRRPPLRYEGGKVFPPTAKLWG